MQEVQGSELSFGEGCFFDWISSEIWGRIVDFLPHAEGVVPLARTCRLAYVYSYKDVDKGVVTVPLHTRGCIKWEMWVLFGSEKEARALEYLKRLREIDAGRVCSLEPVCDRIVCLLSEWGSNVSELNVKDEQEVVRRAGQVIMGTDEGVNREFDDDKYKNLNIRSKAIEQLLPLLEFLVHGAAKEVRVLIAELGVGWHQRCLELESKWNHSLSGKIQGLLEILKDDVDEGGKDESPPL